VGQSHPDKWRFGRAAQQMRERGRYRHMNGTGPKRGAGTKAQTLAGKLGSILNKSATTGIALPQKKPGQRTVNNT
jgi:hypothetical protein